MSLFVPRNMLIILSIFPSFKIIGERYYNNKVFLAYKALNAHYRIVQFHSNL